MKLLFIGDVMLGRLVNDMLGDEPPEYPWGDTLPVFKEADFRAANLECVISDIGEPWSATYKVFHFRTDSKNAEVLKKAGIDFVSLANNHTLDFGYEAMGSMLATLKKEGIAYAGAGPNMDEASAPAFVKVGGTKLALISFTDNEPDWEAGERRPGIFYVPIDLTDIRAKRLLRVIKEAKQKADLVIVTAHWGPNWGYNPPRGHVPFAHALMDAGADIFFGHSGHVFRGVEIYNGNPIMYCGGDFVDDYAVDEVERNDESFIFMVDVGAGRTRSVEFTPTIITRFQARLATGYRADLIARKMQELCKALGTRTLWKQNEGKLVVEVNVKKG